jgi:hypothetical protein
VFAMRSQILTWRRFTFPIGTFALSSSALAQELPSRFFRVIAAVCYDDCGRFGSGKLTVNR